jgi:hypothetical protein
MPSMPSRSLPAVGCSLGHTASERWSVPRAAAAVVLLSGGLWWVIVAIARWLVA